MTRQQQQQQLRQQHAFTQHMWLGFSSVDVIYIRPNLPANSTAINFSLIFIIVICSQSRRRRKNEGRHSFQWLAILYPSPSTTTTHCFHFIFTFFMLRVFVWVSCRCARHTRNDIFTVFGCVHFAPLTHIKPYELNVYVV